MNKRRIQRAMRWLHREARAGRTNPITPSIETAYNHWAARKATSRGGNA